MLCPATRSPSPACSVDYAVSEANKDEGVVVEDELQEVAPPTTAPQEGRSRGVVEADCLARATSTNVCIGPGSMQGKGAPGAAPAPVNTNRPDCRCGRCGDLCPTRICKFCPARICTGCIEFHDCGPAYDRQRRLYAKTKRSTAREPGVWTSRDTDPDHYEMEYLHRDPFLMACWECGAHSSSPICSYRYVPKTIMENPRYFCTVRCAQKYILAKTGEDIFEAASLNFARELSTTSTPEQARPAKSIDWNDL